jgi:hypothetical protein
MGERLSEWWEDLDEIERATWAMVAVMAFAALANATVHALSELR